jgi:hypothetical protein
MTYETKMIDPYHYQQLLGAIGCLAEAMESLPLREELQKLFIELCNTAETERCKVLVRKYRDECLKRDLIKRGELFNDSDRDALQKYMKE